MTINIRNVYLKEGIQFKGRVHTSFVDDKSVSNSLCAKMELSPQHGLLKVTDRADGTTLLIPLGNICGMYVWREEELVAWEAKYADRYAKRSIPAGASAVLVPALPKLEPAAPQGQLASNDDLEDSDEEFYRRARAKGKPGRPRKPTVVEPTP